MITNIHLGNFKAFAETQNIPIKPLTLIFGPNSAGKSSLIHGIALANEAMKTGDLDIYRTTVGGEAIDLGGFRQYVHRRNKDLNVEWAIELDVSKLSGRIAELLAPVKTIAISLIFGIYSVQEDLSGPINEELLEEVMRLGIKDRNKTIWSGELPYKASILKCLTFEILGDGKTLIRTSHRKDGNYRFDRLEPDHPVLREIFKAIVEVYTTSTSFSENDYEGFRAAVSDLLNELTVRIDRFLPRHILKNGAPLESKSCLMAPVSKGTRRENLAEVTKNFLPVILNELIQGLSETVENEINRFQYLGPLRSYPPRHIAFLQYEDINWFAGGGYAWDVVRTDYRIRKKVNEWLIKLKTPYELVIRHLLTLDDIEDEYENKVDRIMDADPPYDALYDIITELKNEEASLSSLQELNLIDERTKTIVSHRDVGIGISQVLPVLVGAYASKEKIIAIEQPEIHLHPALQAELGDVFIESALGENKNTYILETHSEHLILRILKRIRETTLGKNDKTNAIRPEDVALLYIGPSQSGSTVQMLRVDERGRIIDRCPGGFFEEGFEELF